MKKIAIVNGSPKGQGSASEAITTALQDRLTPVANCVVCHAAKHSRDEIMATFAGCDALVFVFPLYVDGIPSHLLRLLDEAQDAVVDVAPNTMVYGVVNNGFYEAPQNRIALELLKNFCARSGLKWGQGLGVGGGGMIPALSIGRGPTKNLGKALDTFAKNILDGKAADSLFVEPRFPRFLYQMIVHLNWRMEAKKYGLKTSQLYDKPW
ncbi:MAG: NAD(P)H-dependent oxidoreductase [Coriobacteriales bacterium]|jgi:hypothetical protein|nr:NAD(P)H-dependent oxidoreductase [Coriobacteriales bacterium]